MPGFGSGRGVQGHGRAARVHLVVQVEEGYQGMARRQAEDLHATSGVGLGHGGMERLGEVGGLHVVVDDHDILEAHAELGPPDHAHHLVGDAGVALLHGHDKQGEFQPRRRIGVADRQTRGGELALGGACVAEHAVENLALVEIGARATDRHDRVIAVGHAVDPEHRPRHARAGAVTGGFTEGALVPTLVGPDVAFDHDLGRCGYEQVVGFAFDEMERLAAQATRDFRFADARRWVHRAHHRRGRAAAKEDGEGHGVPARLVALVVDHADVLVRIYDATHDRFLVDHVAVDAPVHPVAVRVLGGGDAKGVDVAPAIALMQVGRREGKQVDVFAREDVFLARAVGDLEGADGVFHALHELAHQLLVTRLRVHSQANGDAREVVLPSLAHGRAQDGGAVGDAFDISHVRHGRADLADAAADRTDFQVPIDLLVDGHHLARIFAGFHELAQVVEGHVRSLACAALGGPLRFVGKAQFAGPAGEDLFL